MSDQLVRLFRSPSTDPAPDPTPVPTPDPTTLPDPDAAVVDRGIPDDLDDLVHMAKNVSTLWAGTPWLTTQIMTQADFDALVAGAQTTLGARKQDSASKTVKTAQLRSLDEQVEEGIKKIKAYLMGKYEDEEIALSYYPLFGMVKEGTNYRLPSDRQDRLASFSILLAALVTEGFGAKPFGTAYWTTLKTNYTTALGGSETLGASVGGGITTVQPMADQIRRVLISLRFIIRGNYMENYRTAWRQWGFLAENN